MLIAVSILGNPAALDVMRAFCDRHGLYFFEDNCESMGATLNGRECGTFGDIGTFSTFYSHHISTMEGGLLVTNLPEIANLARAIRNHGWARDLAPDLPPSRQGASASLAEARAQSRASGGGKVGPTCADAGPGLSSGVTPADDFFEAYRFIVPGYNVRPLEMCGAVGLEQLKKLDSMLAIRRANAAQFVRLFAGDERFILQRENGRSSWFSFTMILNPALAIDRSRVMNAMRGADIGFRMITGGCFLRHEAVRFFEYDTVGEIVNANIAHDHGFFVGNHPRDLTREISRLREVLDEAAQPEAPVERRSAEWGEGAPRARSRGPGTGPRSRQSAERGVGRGGPTSAEPRPGEGPRSKK
jgi:CDP-6-deoxy-D-xylo-4-hexulose-3-dehydrase